MQSILKIEKTDKGQSGQKEEEQISQLEQINLDYTYRKGFREKKLDTIKKRIVECEQKYERKTQSIIFYILNALIPLLLTITNSYILLKLGIDSELKGQIILGGICGGFIIAVISNLQIAPWKQVVKLYFLIDNIVPVLIAGIIGFYAVFNYLSTNQWYEQGFAFGFPAWVFYYSGSIRVMMLYQKWSKWKLIVYKLITLACALVFFYVGFTYMRGAYKITQGMLQGVDQIIKNTVYLYVFGNCELFFSFYRKISDFDQTNDLKYEYTLKDVESDSVENRKIAEVQYEKYQKEVLQEQIYDNVVTKLKSIKLQELISIKTIKKQSLGES